MPERKDDERQMPFGCLPQEDITQSELTNALQRLQRFLELDPREIQNLEDLSAKVALVGDDLKTVVLGTGEIQETPFEFVNPITGKEVKAIHRVYVIRKPVTGETAHASNPGAITEIYAGVGKDGIHVARYVYIPSTHQQLSEFTVDLPTGMDIQSTNSGVIEDMLHIFAVDWRGESTRSFYPARSPLNAGIQQGFTRVLQTAVKDILSVTPPPTQIPAVFTA